MRQPELVSLPLVPVRETFSVGSALSRSLSIWSRNLVFFGSVSLVAQLPRLVAYIVLVTSRSRRILLVGIVLSWLLGLVVKGLVTYSVLEQLRGRTPPIAESFMKGWFRARQLLNVALSTGFLLLLATAFFVIPGIVLGVGWALVSPVVVAEGNVDARARSEQLTDGHRWGIFGVMVFFLIVSLALSKAAVLFMGLVPGSFLRVSLAVLPDALTSSISAVLYSVMYYQLRSEKEGVDLEELTSVFR